MTIYETGGEKARFRDLGIKENRRVEEKGEEKGYIGGKGTCWLCCLAEFDRVPKAGNTALPV